MIRAFLLVAALLLAAITFAACAESPTVTEQCAPRCDADPEPVCDAQCVECETFARRVCLDLGVKGDYHCYWAFAWYCSDEDAAVGTELCRTDRTIRCDSVSGEPYWR